MQAEVVQIPMQLDCCCRLWISCMHLTNSVLSQPATVHTEVVHLCIVQVLHGLLPCAGMQVVPAS